MFQIIQKLYIIVTEVNKMIDFKEEVLKHKEEMLLSVKEMDLLLMIVMDMLVLLILVKEKNVLVFLDT